MSSDLTTDSTNRQDAKNAKSFITVFPWRFWQLGGLSFIGVVRLLGAMTLGALLLALVYQIPVTHDVNIGGYDAAYVQGFYDPERADAPALAGSDGSARWTRDISYILFPQAGLPAQVTLRLRGKPGAPASEVSVWLNGARELGRFRLGAEWEQHTFAIDGGLLKPNDVVIEIRAPAAPLSADDPRPVGVLLDRATYSTGAPPITPYPTQLAYGALAAGMLYILTKNRPTTNDRRWFSSFVRRQSFVLGLFILCSLFFVLYRAQPSYPYPLRGLLPALDAALAALLALRYGPAAARRVPALLDGLALGGIGVWMVAVLVAARSHVVLSIPGVENDFGVFARRSAQLFGTFQPGGVYPTEVDGVLRADGFYNLGYPLLLWLTRPLTADNPFLAARLIAALSGVLLLGTTWWLARRLLGRGPALIALLTLAFSPFIVEYGLYVGTDMPFAALCALALALLVAPATEQARYIV
ncbi:MAG TPA: glycosyltransferase family 39 protein, partial [Roseiflexaceae bacterium]